MVGTLKILKMDKENMKKANRWKEFYLAFVVDVNDRYEKKCLRRMFSIARRNYIDVFYADKIAYFIRTIDDTFTISSKINMSGKFTKYPSRITLNTLVCNETGYRKNLYGLSCEVILSKSGAYKLGIFNTFYEIIKAGIRDISFIGTISQLNILSTYKDHLEQVPYVHSHSYSLYLVISDFLWFKKGQIVDFYNSNFQYKYHERSPRDLFSGGKWYSIHDISSSLACDLNKITLKELEKIDTNTLSCQKQQFGCSMGCTTYCIADAVNKRDSSRKNFFIETHKKLINLK